MFAIWRLSSGHFVMTQSIHGNEWFPEVDTCDTPRLVPTTIFSILNISTRPIDSCNFFDECTDFSVNWYLFVILKCKFNRICYHLSSCYLQTHHWWLAHVYRVYTMCRWIGNRSVGTLTWYNILAHWYNTPYTPHPFTFAFLGHDRP